MSFESAKGRARYGMTYRNEVRLLSYYGLDGDPIPCSYEGMIDSETGGDHEPHEPDKDSAEWAGSGSPADDAPDNEWIRFWFKCAMEEAMHEALEHFSVDRRVALDPHGPNESMLYETLNGFSNELWNDFLQPQFPVSQEVLDG